MGYVRFAALGDSSTYGIGDPVPGGWRGWARLLADAIGTAHDVSFCNLAVSGAVVADVRHRQLPEALAHQPDLASVIVGVNDTMRSAWDRPRIRAELTETAQALAESGALLLTARFHDHGRVFGLPGMLRRPLMRRLEFLNEVYADLHAAHGGIQVDLAAQEEVWQRAFWHVDRLHPSELGHRAMARAYAARLHEAGLVFEPPAPQRDGDEPTWRSDVVWMVREGAPWVGRRARDLGPWAVRMAWAEAQQVPLRLRGAEPAVLAAPESPVASPA